MNSFDLTLNEKNLNSIKQIHHKRPNINDVLKESENKLIENSGYKENSFFLFQSDEK